MNADKKPDSDDNHNQPEVASNPPEIIKELNAYFDRSRALIEILRADSLIALQEMNRTKTGDPLRPFRQRAFVRTTYALVEGSCFALRSFCGIANELPGIDKLSEDELSYILELPREDKKRPFLLGDDIVKDSFKYAARVLRYDFKLNCNTAGWEALKTAWKYRDRLAHPKYVEEISLSENEIATTHEGLKWFIGEMKRLFDSPMKQ